jgi:hypothetical protein
MLRPSKPLDDGYGVIATHDRVEGVANVGIMSKSEQTSVGVADALGGLVMRLVIGGHNWLFRNQAMPLDARLTGTAFRPPINTAYVDNADVGLGDTCILTVAGDRLTVPDVGRVALPDHGYAWFQRPQSVKSAVVREPGVLTLVTSWWVERPPFDFELIRRFEIVRGGQIHVRFSLENRATAPIPWFWSSHDMIALDRQTELVLPEGEPITVFAAHGFEPADRDHAWPKVHVEGGRALDMSKPAAARRALGGGFACKLFTTSPSGALGVRSGAHELWISGRGTRAALWINWRGWRPDSMKSSRVRYQNLCPERSWGGPTDRVSEGVKQKAVTWIQKGELRRWSMRYAPSPIDVDGDDG